MINNLEEYEDALVYEAEYSHYSSDFNLFLNLKTQGSALDLACGTGRLTIPLAERGFGATGLDASLSMLELARKKSQNLSIKWIQGDFREFDLHQKFDLIIIAGNSFQALLTDEDQIRMLDCVKNHLKSKGAFAFNTRNPNWDDLKATNGFEHWHDFQDLEDKTVHVYGKQDYNENSQIVTYVTKRVWPTHKTVKTIQLRFTPYHKLMEILDNAGFSVINVYGNFEQTPFSTNSPSIIPVCKLK